MYNLVIRHLYTLQIDHHNKSNNHMSAQQVITVLLTIFSMLCITSLWPLYFITKGLYLLIPFTYFIQHPTSLFSGDHQFVLCIYVCFCFVLFVNLFCFLDFTYKLDQMVWFSVWLISLRIIPSRSIHIVTNGTISFFFMAE